MLTAGTLYPTISSLTWSQTLVPTVLSTVLMSYIGFNTGSIIRDPKLDLKPEEYAFAASQVYLNYKLPTAIKNYFRKNS